MFEMFITLIATVFAGLYGFSKSIFMNGPHQVLYRTVLIVTIITILLTRYIYQEVQYNRIRNMGVDLDDYLYYDKYTTLLYRAGYFVSYLIQNILFDYTYMKRNFNFCKGLDVYDGGVSEYYIKFRNTWYKYLSLTLKRHNVSLKKLQAFAAVMKNEMIVNAIEDPEEKAYYRLFEHEASACFAEHHKVTKEMMKQFESAPFVHKTYQKHVLKHYEVLLYVEAHEPRIKELVNLKDFRSKRDVNDYKKMDFR